MKDIDGDHVMAGRRRRAVWCGEVLVGRFGVAEWPSVRLGSPYRAVSG
jgi:hypothetical protein